MSSLLAPQISRVPEALRSADDHETTPLEHDRETSHLVKRLLEHRREFGITRVGSITRLDQIGIPIVQACRPMSLSVSVSQGKGMTFTAAAASAIMESLESWAAERYPEDRMLVLPARAFGSAVVDLFQELVRPDARAQWDNTSIAWCEGWDLLRHRVCHVPASLVDTIYTAHSADAGFFPRSTTGLGAGSSLVQAIVHAALEILERSSARRAHRTPHFFDIFQIRHTEVRDGRAAELIHRIESADFLIGIWSLPSAHSLPAYWCHIMEAGSRAEIAPLPAEGYGCDFDSDNALAKALLEACQSRLAAISGAREDITRKFYPSVYDREHLERWKDQLHPSRGSRALDGIAERPMSEQGKLEAVMFSLQQAGAEAVIVVPLYSDDALGVHVVRVVAPPVRSELGRGE